MSLKRKSETFGNLMEIRVNFRSNFKKIATETCASSSCCCYSKLLLFFASNTNGDLRIFFLLLLVLVYIVYFFILNVKDLLNMLFLLSSWLFISANLIFFIFVLNCASVEKSMRFASRFSLQ